MSVVERDYLRIHPRYTSPYDEDFLVDTLFGEMYICILLPLSRWLQPEDFPHSFRKFVNLSSFRSSAFSVQYTRGLVQWIQCEYLTATIV